MRLLSILTILGISSLNAPAAYAYPEHPAFEHTQFAEDFGMFRWWESCWWRVFDPNIYVLCQPDGDILLVYPDGSVHPASEEDLTRLFASVGDDRRGRSGANRLGLFQPPRAPQSRSPRLSPAQGDGFRLSDVYGGRFTRFDGSTSRFPSINLPSGGTGVFSFDGFGNRFSGDFRPGDVNTDFDGFNFSGRDRDSDSGGFDFSREEREFGGFEIGEREEEDRSNIGLINYLRQHGTADAFADPDGGTRMHDIFYKPIMGRCQSIYDSIDGGMFGPIPCTSHPWGNSQRQ
ncbi:MAG: hypothetical protein HOG89_04170 [Candidatus Peribacter sp.]|jgi:hypothetical protein|nr:hypothetical protein [Candidatus Peribacter sp.]MBT4393363.1 hypothetical protein [Candidatus Peribacter sp.]MBT4600798.1 hypothetical protein [Candidatus Peribacter sp.]MBT5149156.1 hypothetical protein [Candidatus Peribacter sp.]MBT5637871.1 hypothetical protein [Candidatus Peribacter sp.]